MYWVHLPEWTQNPMHFHIYTCDSDNVRISTKPDPEAPVPRLICVLLRFCVFWINSLKDRSFKRLSWWLKYHHQIWCVPVGLLCYPSRWIGLVVWRFNASFFVIFSFWLFFCCGGDGHLLLYGDTVVCVVRL